MIEVIRVATTDQIEKTAQLAAEIWKEHYTEIIGGNQVDYMIDRFQSCEAITAQIDAGELVYFLLCLDRRPEGYFALQIRPNEVFLSKLYVRSSVRRKGLARKAIAFIKSVAADNCLKKISLTVNKNNSLAIESYKRMGFINEGATVADIGEGYVMDDYILALRMS